MSILSEAKMLVGVIGEDIENYFKIYSLDNIYTYIFSIENSLFYEKEITEINLSKNGFERNIVLKKLLKDKLNTVKDKLKYYNWIVKEWGGIKTFGKSIIEINNFIDCINIEKINANQFNTISSYSKIISFINPYDYFIYDSKVAYTLNWLLLKNYDKNNKYFYIPPGRNSDLVKYNMDTIINLYNKNNVKVYHNKKDVYFIYCKFIKLLFEKDKSFIKEPFYIEMMLFGLFNIISNEIKEKVKIIIE